jgi:serine kinase of HPr protein (carbohydrate metabolism regulator)
VLFRSAQELKKTQSRAPSLGVVAKEKVEAMGIKIQAKDIRRAGAETVGLLNQLGAGRIAQESLENTEFITAEVKAEKMKELLERLGFIGRVEEKDARLDSPEKNTAIRIEIVPVR